MKKILKVLLSIILSFSFISDIKAADATYVAIYSNENHIKSGETPVKFLVTGSDDTISIKPMSTFECEGEKKGSNDVWNKQDVRVITSNDSKEKIKDGNFKNLKYLYYDVVEDTLFGGRNNFYLSNSSNINEDYDMFFEKQAEYKQSTPGAILDHLVCTYGPGSNQDMEMKYKYITVELARENNKVKYQLYLDGKSFFPEWIEMNDTYKGSDGEIGYHFITSTGEDSWEYYHYLKDHVSPNNFWSASTDVYGCPSLIEVGYYEIKENYALTASGEKRTYIEIGWEEIMDKEYTDITNPGIWKNEYSHLYQLNLYENASYVNYKEGIKGSELCMYSTEVCNPDIENCDDEWKLGLKESYGLNGKGSYLLFQKSGEKYNQFDDVYFDMYSGLINDDCSNLPIIYTNCLNGDRSSVLYQGYGAGPSYVRLDKETCIVSSTEFSGSEKVYSNKYIDEYDKDHVEEIIGEDTGLRYKQLMCQLKPMLQKYSTTQDLNKTTDLDFYSVKSNLEGSYNITQLPCSIWGTESNFSCDDKCENELAYLTNKQIREVINYCNDVNKDYLNEGYNDTLMNGRYQECQKFNDFYDSLVQNGIISDMFVGCDFISNDLRDKLELILDVIKIAGPVLAIVFGMWDFTKVLFTGDADKEMKTAGKRFITRLIAAALLFLIPALISIPLNVALGDKTGNNPFCDLDKRE